MGDQIRQPRQTFVALDHDGDGILTFDEVRRVLQNDKSRATSENSASNLNQLLSDLDAIVQEQQQTNQPTDGGMNGAVFTMAEGDEVACPKDMDDQQMFPKKLDSVKTDRVDCKLDANTAERCSHYTYTEFLAATFDRQQFIRKDVCRIAFNVLDSNGDGLISKDELAGHLLGRLSEKELAQLVQEIDENGD